MWKIISKWWQKEQLDDVDDDLSPLTAEEQDTQYDTSLRERWEREGHGEEQIRSFLMLFGVGLESTRLREERAKLALSDPTIKPVIAYWTTLDERDRVAKKWNDYRRAGSPYANSKRTGSTDGGISPKEGPEDISDWLPKP